MSQVDELLDGLTDEQIAEYSANVETEPHIVIGEDRFIKVPDELKRLAVQYDHNVETVTFDCPRFWDEHDMSKMVVYINYKLPNNYNSLGSYPADDVTVDVDDENIMHFKWTISRNVTQFVGKISFLVCIKDVDDEGNETNHWNSELNQECYISQGMESDVIAEAENADLITQLLLKMKAAESALSADVAWGVANQNGGGIIRFWAGNRDDFDEQKDHIYEDTYTIIKDDKTYEQMAADIEKNATDIEALDANKAPYELVTDMISIDGTGQLDATIDNIYAGMRNYSIKHITVNDAVGVEGNPFAGGVTHLTIYKTNDAYGFIEAGRYSVNGVGGYARKWVRTRNSSTWGEWVRITINNAIGTGNLWVSDDTDIDTLVQCGWYSCNKENISANKPFDYPNIFVLARGTEKTCTQIAVDRALRPGEIKIRSMYNNIWGEWEYENPPMKVGQEYRTTERYNGRPVYRKLLKYEFTKQLGNQNTVTSVKIPTKIDGTFTTIRCSQFSPSGVALPYLADNGGITAVTHINPSKQINLKIYKDYWTKGTFVFDLAYIKE